MQAAASRGEGDRTIKGQNHRERVDTHFSNLRGRDGHHVAWGGALGFMRVKISVELSRMSPRAGGGGQGLRKETAKYSKYTKGREARGAGLVDMAAARNGRAPGAMGGGAGLSSVFCIYVSI